MKIDLQRCSGGFVVHSSFTTMAAVIKTNERVTEVKIEGLVRVLMMVRTRHFLNLL